jgi:hypothetical protein
LSFAGGSGCVVIWIGGRPGESVGCGRSTGVKLVAHRATTPAFVARTSTATFAPAVCGVTVSAARPSVPASTARCGTSIADDADVATDTWAPLAVWTITWVGAPRFGVGFETVAVQEIGAELSLAAGVGAGVADDDGVVNGEGAFKIADGEVVGAGGDPEPAPAVFDGVWLAQADTTASATVAQPSPAARVSEARVTFTSRRYAASPSTASGRRASPGIGFSRRGLSPSALESGTVKARG